jgi:hypothetical protein
MPRHVSNGRLPRHWIAAVACALGLAAGCASTGAGTSAALPQPTHADLQRLVAQEIEADSRFDSFGASDNADAHRLAATFKPVLADVHALDCRAAPAGSVDCTLEVILRFPAMDGREARTFWERRLRQVQGSWQWVGQAQP